jgi:23S rRNA (uracil1939-C5)-methyltransferase
MLPKTITLTIEKLVFGGQALAHAPSGQVVFVWNALPGEVVEAEITKRYKTHWEGTARTIITPSANRRQPEEEHYLICSPWQIMTETEEQHWKEAIAVETYRKIGGFELKPTLYSYKENTGYRTKMEYSFTLHDGKISFAFFERGQHRFHPHQGCTLADPVINQVALPILAWINAMQIPLRSLRSLIIRSNGQGKAIAALFIKDELVFSTLPELSEELLGFQLYYSYYKTPAAVPTKLLATQGQTTLTTTINGTRLTFGLLSFFQIHVPVFSEALRDIGRFLSQGAPVIDYYGGVGSIALPLHALTGGGVIVDNNAEAIDFAQKNITDNAIERFQAICQPSEKITELITPDAAIIVDPPRAGLHPDVIKALLQKLPRQIIYLSCNISTQARDCALLLENYTISFSRLYNFFPRTPHLEALIILTKISSP